MYVLIIILYFYRKLNESLETKTLSKPKLTTVNQSKGNCKNESIKPVSETNQSTLGACF